MSMDDLAATLAVLTGPTSPPVRENLLHLEALIDYLEEGRKTFERMAENVPGTLFYVKTEHTGDNCLQVSITPMKPRTTLRSN